MVSGKRVLFFFIIIALTPFLFVYIVSTYPYFVPPQEVQVYFVGETNTLKEQTIFLESDDGTIIKINNTSKPIYFMEGDEVKGYFFETEKQRFYHSRTGIYFHGQVLHKRALNPTLSVAESKNIYIKGENNTYVNNTIAKGENNVSRNNVYIAESNNTITGNTHHQGSNNVYEDNVIIGSSNNTITDTTTCGSSNRTVKGQVIGGSGTNGGNDYSSNNNSWWNEPIIDVDNPIFKAFCYIFYFLVILFVVFSFGIPMYISYTDDRQKFFENCKNFVLCIIYFMIAPALALIAIRKTYLSLSAIHICLICSVLTLVAVIYLYRKHLKNKKEAELRRIEWEKQQAEQYKKEQERKIAYQKEQERISTLPTHYVGNVETGKYHHSRCTYAKNLHPIKKECFETREDAENMGYSPCSVCKHKER